MPAAPPPATSAPYRILRLEETASTNAMALRLAMEGEAGPLWVMADRQTGGKGRSGRPWSSEPGNLHASLLLRFPLPLAGAYQLSLVAGVAAIDAIRAAVELPAGCRLQLKWPNDILAGRLKAGGILVESAAAGGELCAVIGIGLNLARHPEAYASTATHLASYARCPEAAEFLLFLADAMNRWISTWDMGQGFGRVREAWLERAMALGERISVNSVNGPLSGAFGGLDGDGALLLAEPDGAIHRINYGDVTLEP